MSFLNIRSPLRSREHPHYAPITSESEVTAKGGNCLRRVDLLDFDLPFTILLDSKEAEGLSRRYAMSEVGGVAQQLRGAQAVAQNGQQQQQVREDREERETQRNERLNAVREERDVRTERHSQSRTAAASAQQVGN